MAKETEGTQYRYFFNMVFDFIIKSFEIKMDFLKEKNKERVRSWRYDKKPKPNDFYTLLLNKLEELLDEIICRVDALDDRFVNPKTKNFIKNAKDQFADYIKPEELNNIFNSSKIVDVALDLLTYSYNNPEITIIQKAILNHENTDDIPSKKTSPMLDKELRSKFKELGIEVETEDDLYDVAMNISFNLLNEHEHEDQAFQWLYDLAFVESCQERICSFAFQLYDGKDYPNSFKILHALADAKFGYALVQLGLMYEQGIYVEENTAKAFSYYLQAARAGLTFAQTCVGDCYLYGKGVHENIGQAYRWYSKVADIQDAEGSEDAQLGVVICLRSMYLSDESEYLQQILILNAKKYAEWGNPKVQYVLACMYNQGIGVKKDYSLAIFWMKKAADAGLENAIKILEDEDA